MEAGPGPVRADDAQWLVSEVFAGHPLWRDKRGTGVERVDMRKMPPFGSLSFWLIRSDGTAIDISYRESINPSSQHAKVVSAARYEVEPDVYRWKTRNPAPAMGMHCDHLDPPFDALFKDFLATEGISEANINVRSEVVGHADIFADRVLAVRWQQYHRKHATLQWLTAAENIQKSNQRPAAA